MTKLIEKWNETNPDYPIESLSDIDDWMGSTPRIEVVAMLLLAGWSVDEISQLISEAHCDS